MCTEDSDAWLIAWGEASEVGAHDHGGSHGAIRVLRGLLVEEYRKPGPRLSRRQWRRRTIRPGPVDRDPARPRAQRVEPRTGARVEPARVLAAAGADEFLSAGRPSRSWSVTPQSIDDLLAHARSGLQRVSPDEAAMRPRARVRCSSTFGRSGSRAPTARYRARS